MGKPKIPQDIIDVKGSVGNLNELETVNKSSLVKAINEVRNSGGGSGRGVFMSGLEQGSFTATADTTTFTISSMKESKIEELIFENYQLVVGQNYEINKSTGVVTLSFTLKANETIYYRLFDSSYSYNDLSDKLIVEDSLTSTTKGRVLDASQGKVLDDKIGVLSSGRGYIDSALITSLDETFYNGKYRYGGEILGVSGTWVIDVTKAGSGFATKQVATCIWSSSPTPLKGATIYRTWVDGAWTTWKQLATTGDTTALDNKITVLQGLSNDFKIYKKISEINPAFNHATNTTNDIISNMVDNSVYFGAEAPSDAPNTTLGMCMIIKRSGTRNSATVWDYYGNTYTYSVRLTGTTTPSYGWQQLATTEKIDILLEPILNVGWSKLSVTPRCFLNNLGQLVFDGTIQNKTATTASTVCILPPNARPNRNINTFVYTACTEGTLYKDLVEVVIFTDGRIEFRPTKSYTYYSLSSIPPIYITV